MDSFSFFYLLPNFCFKYVEATSVRKGFLIIDEFGIYVCLFESYSEYSKDIDTVLETNFKGLHAMMS